MDDIPPGDRERRGRYERFRAWVFAVVGGVMFLVVVGFVAGLGLDTARGYGVVPYRSFWGVEWMPIGVLVIVAVLPFALVVGAILRWRERREERDLENKYRRPS